MSRPLLYILASGEGINNPKRLASISDIKVFAAAADQQRQQAQRGVGGV